MFELRPTPCAVTKSDWEKDKDNFTCKSPINVYHCLQDEKNRSGEICIQPVWVQRDYCPEFNTGAWALDTVPCNVTKGCPNVTFLSNEVYQYPVCLNKTHRKELSDHGEYSAPWLWIAGPILLLITLLAIAITFFVWRRKGKRRREEDECGYLLLERAENSEPFHQTAAFHESKHYLEGGGKFLVLSGIWGSGKTKTAKEVYRSVTGISPTLITDLEKFYCEEQNQALVFDEAIPEDLSKGEMRRLQEKIKAWLERVSTRERKTFIIFTSVEDRKSIFAYITSTASDKNLKVINLKDRLTKGDQTQILNSQFTIFCPNNKFSEIEDLATKGKHKSLGYPEICALFCRCDEFQKMKGVEFCKTPLRYLKSYLEEMYDNNVNKFLMLVYLSLNQMEIDVANSNEMLLNELETCKSNQHKQAKPLVGTIIEFNRHGKVENIDSLMSWEFVDKVPNTSKYRLQHDVIKRMTLIVFGTFHFDKLLELSKPEDLEGWIKEKGIGTKLKNAVGDIMPSLFIDGKKWLQHGQKMAQKTAEDSQPFHKTEAFHEAIKYLKEGGKFLVLSGLWGCGKTKTAKEVYRSVTGKSPRIITDVEKFNTEEQNHALVFDEAISEELSEGEMRRLQEKIKTWLEKVSTGETKTFIIFTSVKDRKSTFADMTSVASDAGLKVINLNDRLTKDDRTQILKSHFTISCPKKDFSKIEDLATNGNHESLGYPEICALFCRCDEFQKMKGVEFCKTPLRSLKSYFEEMYNSQQNKFLMLVYMSLNQMEIDVKNPNEMLFNELETCKSNKPKQADPLVGPETEIVRLSKVEDIQSLMSWGFVDKVPNTSKYRLQHDVIKRMTLIVFGTFHFDKLLELSKPEDLEGWIKEDGVFMKQKKFFGDIIPILLVNEHKWERYVYKNKMSTVDKTKLLEKPDVPCYSKSETIYVQMSKAPSKHLNVAALNDNS